ncbi:hypothetical protein Hypma_006196 [Hypsizygus marmoreus]|uniref:Uncharacterized protein n=1 Tax=Hypsizygus marmoreus TaxID=39966 RepID=A0A369JXS3_HYPMA|nr:hypothetical protein Hypma_006196 [Hypsizygus marmoreus]
MYICVSKSFSPLQNSAAPAVSTPAHTIIIEPASIANYILLPNLFDFVLLFTGSGFVLNWIVVGTRYVELATSKYSTYTCNWILFT